MATMRSDKYAHAIRSDRGILVMGIGAGAAFGDTPDVAVVESDPPQFRRDFGSATVACPPGRLATGGRLA